VLLKIAKSEPYKASGGHPVNSPTLPFIWCYTTAKKGYENAVVARNKML